MHRLDEHDIKHILALPYADFLAIRARRLPPEELNVLYQDLRRQYLELLRQQPVRRLWRWQWEEELRRNHGGL